LHLILLIEASVVANAIARRPWTKHLTTSRTSARLYETYSLIIRFSTRYVAAAAMAQGRGNSQAEAAGFSVCMAAQDHLSIGAVASCVLGLSVLL
jgi:hypothetical protein